MRTSHLILRLVHDVSPVGRDVVGRRLSQAPLARSSCGALLLVGVVGIFSDMPEQVLAIVFTTAIGAAFGPGLLRW